MGFIQEKGRKLVGPKICIVFESYIILILAQEKIDEGEVSRLCRVGPNPALAGNSGKSGAENPPNLDERQ